MANFLNDTFTEASATNITSHTPEAGGSWLLHSGYATVTPVVGAGTGRVSVTSATAIIPKLSSAPPSPNYSVTATGQISAASGYVGVLGRLQPTGLNCICGWLNNGKAEIYRYGGSGSALLFTAAYSYSTGTDYTLKLLFSGTTITLQVNGVTVGSGTDASITTAGNVGLFSVGTASYTSFSADDEASASLTLSGPSSGLVGAASTNFTVTLVNGTGAVVFTPTSSAGTGTFSPTTVDLSVGTPTGTFTYTPTSSGARNISGTNDSGLSGPSAVSYTGTASDSITQTEQVANRNYQRTGAAATVTFDGTYSGTLPASVEVKIVNAVGGTTAQDWAALSSPTISGGAWSGSLSVPQGGMYNFISRTKNGASVLATASQSTNAFGVGAIFVVAGQSNGARMFTVGVVSPIATTNQYNGAYVANAGAGSCTLANAISTNLGIPVTMVNTAVEGSGLIVATASPYGSWADTSGALYTNWKNKVTALGGKIEGVLWLQGEWDASNNATKSDYKADFLAIIARMRAYTGQPSLPFFITPLTRYTGGVFVGWDNVQDAFMESFDSTVKKTCDTWDLPSGDGLHYNVAGQTILGGRIALAVRKYFGQSVDSLGPTVASVVSTGTTVDITFSHVSGSDITPSSGITGLAFTANGIAATPISVVRQSATVVRATFASSLAVPVYASVAVSTNPDASAPLKDSAGFPAQRTATAGILAIDGDATAPGVTLTGLSTIAAGSASGASAKSASVTLVNAANAPQVSLTGLKWAWFDGLTPDVFAAPTDKGIGEITDGSGVLQVLIQNSTKTSGQVGWLVVTDSDGTTAMAHKAFSGPVAVT